MPYFYELAAGQRLSLDNQGTQTVLTLTSSSPGQQQQSSSSFQTGSLTAPPEVFQTAQGVVIKLPTAAGDRLIQIQGSHISLLDHSHDVSSAQPIHSKQTTAQSSTPPMQPMQPMSLDMGNMQMNMNPMQMRMGDMELKMGSPAASASEPPLSETSSKNAQAKRFCSQCGTAVEGGDRFCSSCGHQLRIKV